MEVATVADETDEPDSRVTVTVEKGDGNKLGDNTNSEARTTILDDDAANLPGGTVAVEGTTIWTADMTVTDYGNGNVGAGSSDLLANQRGSAGLQARWLYYETEPRKLRMAFTTGVDTGELTLAAGNVKLSFPENTSGDSSFSWNNVDVDWSGGQTFEARLVRGEREATEAPDPTLKSLTISDATLSPAFDPETVAYTATVGAETTSVTLAATTNDDDASVAYNPATDADAGTAGHQVAVAVGETVATVTVTAADGETTRAYRVVVTRPAPQVTPLTASFSNMPAEHGGSEFSFDLTFSEEPKVGYAALRDDAFTLTGNAKVNQAKRKTQGSNQSWTIRVDPKGTDGVTVTLPATTTCTATGAICTSDGRKLTNSTSATVRGPVGISIADVEVTEAAGAVLAFTVSLTRAASNQLTVDYATSDGSATAGADYTAASGTLTIGAGSSSGTIQVSVLDDEHNEGSETFSVTLSNATSGQITDATATGTITNHDALPAALVARFGRTAAIHVLEQVEERVNAPRAPGFDGRVAGRQIHRGMGRDFAVGFLQQVAGGRMHAGGSGNAMGGRSGRGAGLHRGTGTGTTTTGLAGTMGPADGAFGASEAYGTAGGPMGFHLGGGLLEGSDFALNRAAGDSGSIAFWSRSAQSSFHGQDGLLGLNGDVRTTMFGADYSRGRMVTGVSLSHSRGLGSYSGVDSGTVTSAVTGLYPWIGYKATERVTLWTVAGYGAGGLMLTPGVGAPIETGMSMAMAGGGGRGQLLGNGDGFGLAVKADALWVGTHTDAAAGAGGRLDATSAAVSRLRTALEGSRSMTLRGRLALTPSVELGFRHDGGDAETGTGLDLGAGVVIADAVTGLAIDLRVRTLVVHQAEGFQEHGVSVSVSYDPTPTSPLGFMARVAPAWGGESMSGAEALWGGDTMAGLGHGRLLGQRTGTRLESEVGYGLSIGSRFVGTPRAGIRTSEYGRDYRLCYSMSVLEANELQLQVGIEAEQRHIPSYLLQDHGGGREQRVLGQATVEW